MRASYREFIPDALVRATEEESNLRQCRGKSGRGLAPVIVAILCGLAVAACGSSKPSSSAGAASSSGGSSASSSSTTAKASGKPIALGAIVTETGPVATGGGYEYATNAAKAWVAWKNATGGVNGHPVTMKILDDQGTPATEQSDARELVQQDHVAAVFIEDQSASEAAPYLASQNIPLFSSLGDGGHTAKTNTWFGVDTGPPYGEETSLLADKAAGAKKASNAVCSEVAVCLSFGKVLAKLAQKIGMTPGITTSIAETATSATAQCVAMIQAKSDAINMYVGSNPISLIANACGGQGYKGIYTTASVVDTVVKAVKAPLVLAAGSFPWWASNPPAVQYRQIMSKYAPGANYQGVYASNMWELLQVFSHAMTAKGPASGAAVTGKDVISAMQTGVKNLTLGGILPQPVTFSAHGQTTVRCFWPAQYKNGQFGELQGSWTAGNGATGALKSDCIPANNF